MNQIKELYELYIAVLEATDSTNKVKVKKLESFNKFLSDHNIGFYSTCPYDECVIGIIKNCKCKTLLFCPDATYFNKELFYINNETICCKHRISKSAIHKYKRLDRFRKYAHRSLEES